MNKDINNVFWHDGVLQEVSLAIDERGLSVVVIVAMTYDNKDAKCRDRYRIICEEVSRFSTTANTYELMDNMSAGNIVDGYLKTNSLWIYLVDGIIEVHAKKYHVNKVATEEC